MATTPPYDFTPYLEARGRDWLADDPLLSAWLARSDLPADVRALVERFGRDAATVWVERSDVAGWRL